MISSTFDLVLQKEFQDAYDKFTVEYESTQNRIALKNRSIAALNLKRYDDALSDRLRIIGLTADGEKSDSDYLDAAVVYWLLGDLRCAVDICKVGLNDPSYTLPLYSRNLSEAPAFLYYASLVLKDKSLEQLALRLMKRKARIGNPISQFLVGQLTQEEYRNTLTKGALRDRQKCKMQFYLAVDCLRKDDREGYVHHLQGCVAAEGHFLEYEYYLAIGELATDGKPIA